jgi:hypothetical protein
MHDTSSDLDISMLLKKSWQLIQYRLRSHTVKKESERQRTGRRRRTEEWNALA